MNTPHHRHRVRKLVGALVLAAAAGASTGCGTGHTPEPAPETESDSAQPEQTPGDQPTAAYAGPYDEDFRTEADSYAGQRVTLTGEVADRVPSRSALVLTDPENPELDPLLVSAQYAFPDAGEGAVVDVTGTLQTNVQARVDQDDVDNEAGFYDRHIGQPCLDQASLGAE